MSPSRTTIHRRISCFVDWIRPPDNKEEDIRAQADRIRKAISAVARTEGLTIASTPNSGSFAKRTGLRRHLPGGSVVEGLDVDLPFVIRFKDRESLDDLLVRFTGFARTAYPDHAPQPTKSSVVLEFSGTKLRYDIVPMLATDASEEQILIRADGQRIHTSIQRHVQFVRDRTRRSNEMEGRVKFNECVRLVKWWREFKQADSALSDVPSIVVELLCASAFEACSVRMTYHETLSEWFGFLAHAVRKRHRVAFADYCAIPVAKRDALWEVLDPVNAGNNVVGRWSNWQIDLLAEWLADGRDAWARAIAADLVGDDAGSMRELITLFGTPFKHHCEGE